jgi:hypothetical protein
VQDPITKVLSYGGGIDSFAMLLNAIDRGELPDLVIFADVGDPNRVDPGEWPGTYNHIEQVVMPLCQEQGIEFKWLTTDEIPIRGERSLFRYMEVKRMMPGRISRMCTVAARALLRRRHRDVDRFRGQRTQPSQQRSERENEKGQRLVSSDLSIPAHRGWPVPMCLRETRA